MLKKNFRAWAIKNNKDAQTEQISIYEAKTVINAYIWWKWSKMLKNPKIP